MSSKPAPDWGIFKYGQLGTIFIYSSNVRNYLTNFQNQNSINSPEKLIAGTSSF